MAGIGGFLQEFLSVPLLGIALECGRRAASLTSQLGGVVLRGLAWQSRRVTVAIGPDKTIVTLNGGPPLPLITPSSTQFVAAGRMLTVATRPPDITPDADSAVCGGASSTISQPGVLALAAVEGNHGTDWLGYLDRGDSDRRAAQVAHRRCASQP